MLCHFPENQSWFCFSFQHLLSHAAPRPFVCGRCDAGFVSQHQLESHLKLHEAAWRNEALHPNNNNNSTSGRNNNNAKCKTLSIIWGPKDSTLLKRPLHEQRYVHSQLCIALIDLYECVTQHPNSKPSREIEMFLSCIAFWLGVSVTDPLVQTSVWKLASSFL